MACVALLSNPNSTGNLANLPEVRAFCARNDAIFHYEVDHVDQIDEALATIAKVQPKIIVINGGDGTVQAALTGLLRGHHFGENVPPVAALPGGKTNLIALDLGAEGDPMQVLQRIVDLAQTDFRSHVVTRELIALSDGQNDREVFGMFLGGAGLSEFILYCRHKLYPLGLPNFLAHLLTVFAALASLLLGLKGSYLPKQPSPMRISVIRDGQFQGRFSVLIVTTLEKLLLMSSAQDSHMHGGRMKFIAIETGAGPVLRFIYSALLGKLGQRPQAGIHLDKGASIKIEGEESNVLLDGEIFTAREGHPIMLRSTPPVSFLKLAA